MKPLLLGLSCLIALLPLSASAQETAAPYPAATPQLRTGTYTGILGPATGWHYKLFKELKNAGIDAIEISAKVLLLKENLTPEAMEARCRRVKAAADSAGLEIWSIHMPFGRDVDISHADSIIRQNSLDLHISILPFLALLKPKIILFHPSWYVLRKARETQLQNLMHSVKVLQPAVEKTGAKMVLENMLGERPGPDVKYEDPLLNTVKEIKAFMRRAPHSVGLAVDMNHTDRPERLIRAMGRRVWHIHVCDGDGRRECHFLPGARGGENDWDTIITALYRDAHYTGPFMYEVKNVDFHVLKPVTDSLFKRVRDALPPVGMR